MDYEKWILPSNSRGLMPFTEQEVTALVIDENDIGSPNMRNRSTHGRVFHSFYMSFTQAQWATVKYWVKYNLQNGIMPFLFPKADEWTPDQSLWSLYRFALDKTEGAWYQDYSYEAGRVKVQFLLELV